MLRYHHLFCALISYKALRPWYIKLHAWYWPKCWKMNIVLEPFDAPHVWPCMYIQNYIYEYCILTFLCFYMCRNSCPYKPIGRVLVTSEAKTCRGEDFEIGKRFYKHQLETSMYEVHPSHQASKYTTLIIQVDLNKQLWC